MSTTRADIVTEVFYLLGEPDDSTTYDRAIYVIPKINAVIRQVCKGNYKDVRGEAIYSAGDMRFIRKQMAYTTHLSVGLTANANVGDVTLSLDTTNYATSGAVMINNNIITYTGVTPTTFTGVSGIQAEILGGSTVYQLCILPTDYFKDFMMKAVRLGNTYDVSQNDFRFSDSISNYMIVGDYSNQYLFITGDTGVYWFYYYSTVADMATDATVCVLPDDYGKTVIAPIVAGELLFQTEENGQAMNLLALGFAKLQIMYKEYAELTKKPRKKVRYQGTRFDFIFNPIQR